MAIMTPQEFNAWVKTASRKELRQRLTQLRKQKFKYEREAIENGDLFEYENQLINFGILLGIAMNEIDHK